MKPLADGTIPIIRPIEPRDDAAVAAIIRTVMPEFGACGEGFAINDAEVDTMFAAYSQPRCAYFVVDLEGRVLGGGGIAPLSGADPELCELRKMYFLSELRGLGAGHELIEQCLSTARELGYKRCYLETLENMYAARALYEKVGFAPIDCPLGDTGHYGCDAFYLRDL